MEKWKKIAAHIGAYPAALAKWLAVGALIGGIGGVIGSLFHIGVNYATQMRAAHPWILYLLPVLGLIIVGLYRVTKVEGKDTNAVIESVHFGKNVPVLLVPVIFISTVLTHLGGGSAGREGAALQIGGGIGFEAGRLLRLFAPVALVLYLDALVDGMLKGLSEQVANVRYNTITSALDVALLFVLLPRYGLGGYVFTFIAAHLVNFALSLRRLLRVTGLRASAGAAVRTALLAVGAGAAALLTPAPGPEAAELLLRGAVYAGTYGLAACVSGTAELCVPESLRPARRAEKARALR